jgi:Small metal-binding protein
MQFRRVIAILSLALALFLTPRIVFADDHLAEAIKQAKEAIKHGKMGHADGIISHAEAALTQLRAAEHAKANPHVAEGIVRFEAAIASGRQGRADIAVTHIEAALTQLEAVQSEAVLPSRMFAGPGQYPPKQFKAYGIVAFNAGPTAADKSRYEMICDAYVTSLLHYTKVKEPMGRQMVTVWPVEWADLATRINAEAREKVCADAVPHYGVSIAQEAIEVAKRNKAVLNGQGPFLLAWSPGAAKGQPNALVLVADMSNVVNNEDAKELFKQWALDIQNNPELWNNGWDKKKLTLVVRLAVDRWGKKMLQAVGMGK